jgi:carbon-monoxide dehydrogenase medium subunit
MLALGANVVVEGPNGSREIGIDDFFPDFFTTALEPEEILTEIRIPSPPSGSGGAYLKIERKVGDYAAAAVACQLNIDSGGSIQKIGIGLTNVGSTPIRASSAEQLLQGKNPDENMIAEAGRLSAADSEPMEDLRGSAEYKRALVNELTQRAIKLSLQRAEGSR